MLCASGLSKAYGSVQAVRGLSLEVGPGRSLGVLGPNGAGKSTTLRMLVGLLWPDEGSAAIAGHDVFREPELARALLGYLPESGAVYTEMTPQAYLRFRCALFGIRKPQSLIDRALERCRLRDIHHRSIRTLSKGLKQRVALAGAIVHDPPVLILDEPTNGLDVAQLREARGVLRELASEKTLLISSHLLGEIEHIADDVAIIAGGRLITHGPIDQVRSGTGQVALVFEADAPSSRARSLLPDALPEPEVEDLPGSGVRLSISLRPTDAPEELCREIGARAQRKNIALMRLEVRRPSLEDAFVGLVSDGSAK